MLKDVSLGHHCSKDRNCRSAIAWRLGVHNKRNSSRCGQSMVQFLK
eukprot:SM011900S25460  [mRNA]  locus=s11900:99:338:- [translate_table: standard]